MLRLFKKDGSMCDNVYEFRSADSFLGYKGYVDVFLFNQKVGRTHAGLYEEKPITRIAKMRLDAIIYYPQG